MTIADGRHVGTMSFLDHVRELRKRLVISLVAIGFGAIFGYALYHQYVPWFIEPFGEEDLIIPEVQQGFTLRIKVACYVGIIFSFPVHLYNLVAFILPALTQKERRYVGGFLAGSLVLMTIGGYLAYFQILPLAVSFLKGEAFVPAGVETQLFYDRCLMFVFQIVLAFMALFQLPLILLLLMAMNVIKRSFLLRTSRVVIIIVFVISALVTPPDIVSQVGLACPLILLFYLAILIAKVLKFGEDEPDD
jgi:sec-independent protein translocase protein TatC